MFSIDDEGIQQMIEAADTDGSGKISKDEFLRVMKKTKILWLFRKFIEYSDIFFCNIFIKNGQKKLLLNLTYS